MYYYTRITQVNGVCCWFGDIVRVCLSNKIQLKAVTGIQHYGVDSIMAEINGDTKLNFKKTVILQINRQLLVYEDSNCRFHFPLTYDSF